MGLVFLQVAVVADGWAFEMVSIPIKAPNTRPVLPRISSSASAFRFCGIILDDVQKLSSIRIKPNSLEQKIIKSSLNRGQMRRDHRTIENEFRAKIPVADGVDGVIGDI